MSLLRPRPQPRPQPHPSYLPVYKQLANIPVFDSISDLFYVAAAFVSFLIIFCFLLCFVITGLNLFWLSCRLASTSSRPLLRLCSSGLCPDCENCLTFLIPACRGRGGAPGLLDR